MRAYMIVAALALVGTAPGAFAQDVLKVYACETLQQHYGYAKTRLENLAAEPPKREIEIDMARHFYFFPYKFLHDLHRATDTHRIGTERARLDLLYDRAKKRGCAWVSG